MGSWKPSALMLRSFNEAVTRFVADIEEVPDELKGELHEIVWVAIMAQGRRANDFARDVASRFRMDLNSAADISRFQSTMGRYAKGIARRAESGIKESKWGWSNAPCENMPYHEALNGQRFRLEEGLVVHGKRIWPGSEVGCHCCEVAAFDHIEGFE